MFTQPIKNENKVFVNPVQESPNRISIYGINKCEDQVIGFEFVSNQYVDDPRCCGNIMAHLCIPIEIVTPIQLDSVEFWATDDPCYKEWVIQKNQEPDVEIQRIDAEDSADVTGIVVRFSQYDTCCYPPQMAFRLYGFDTATGCKYILSAGLLMFR